MEDEVLEVLELLKSGAMPKVSALLKQGYSEATIDSVKAHIDVKTIHSIQADTGEQIVRLAMPKQV